MDVYKNLDEAKIQLPIPIKDGSFINVIQPFGEKFLYISGTGNTIDGDGIRGKIPRDVSEEDGIKAARNAARNILAALHGYLGDLNRIKRMIKTLVFVASDADFCNQHIVANGATEVFILALGEKRGKSARSAVGVASLPLNYTVEIEAIVEIGDLEGSYDG